MEQERECSTCFFEDTPVDEKPCLDCEIRDRWDNWKPKQQKFLTPGEWLRDQYPEKYSGEYIQTGGYHDACMHFAFESGEKQGIKKGRLERDQELRPAIDLARKVKKLYWELKNHLIFATLGMQDLFESKLQQLDDELNNLKPVNGNE